MRKTILTIFLLSFILSACSGAAPAPTQTSPPPTPEPAPTLPPPTATAELEPTLPPTEEPEPTLTLALEENFDQTLEAWSEPVVTTNIPYNYSSQVSLDEEWIFFNIQNNDTYLYAFNEELSEADVVIETTYISSGPSLTDVAVVCRAADDYSRWYEFRIMHRYEYHIYYYEKDLKELQGKNPYIDLVKGAIPQEMLDPGKENAVRATCRGNRLELELNGQELTRHEDDRLTEAGRVGFGALAHNLLPVNVWFDYLKVYR